LHPFIEELKRRNVVRVALAYLAVAWLMIQLVGEIGPILNFPEWLPKLILGMLGIGFLITVILAWIYEITDKGLKRTEEMDQDAGLHSKYNRQLNYIVIGALALALSYFVWESRFFEPPASTETLDSIAVLPFTDMSPGGDQEYFADGMAEELLGALSRIPGLKVTGRSSSFAFKNQDVDLRSIATQLGVTHILEGSVRTSGNQLRVTAQLINAEDGFQVWSQEYNGELSDIFGVQDEISEQVVAGLKLHIGSGGSSALPRMTTTSNMQAYDEYLLGRYHLARRTPESILQAANAFRVAISGDPGFSPAYSALAITLAVTPYYRGVESLPELAEQATGAALKAISLDEQNNEAFTALGYISLGFDRDWATAAESLKRAVALHPNDAVSVNFYGDYLYAIGDYQQAEIYEKRAAELEPLSAANHHELALVYYLMGRVEDAITLERMAIELNPDFQNARSTLARLLLETGLHDELDELMEEPGTTIGERSEIWMKARLLIEQDKHEAALIEAERLVQLTTEKGQSQVRAAMLFALLNEDAVAAELLEKAHAEGDPILISPLYFFLPEDWTGLPLVQQALDKPDLGELYDLRRANISAGKGRVVTVLNR
jgi:TolB-like protein/Tfp pilus assembly protein PilF